MLFEICNYMSGEVQFPDRNYRLRYKSL